jgi:hypothetical protein
MKQFILTALLSTTILSSSLTLPAIAGGHSSQKAIGETTAPVRYFDGGGIGGSGATVVQMVVH